MKIGTSFIDIFKTSARNFMRIHSDLVFLSHVF